MTPEGGPIGSRKFLVYILYKLFLKFNRDCGSPLIAQFVLRHPSWILISETPGAQVCTVCTECAHSKCAQIFFGPLKSVHTFFWAFSGVCTHFFQCFCECAHQFYGHFLRVRTFFEAWIQECAALFYCCSSVHSFSRPAAPNTRVRVPDSGYWLAVPPAGGLSHSFHRRFHWLLASPRSLARRIGRALPPSRASRGPVRLAKDIKSLTQILNLWVKDIKSLTDAEIAFGSCLDEWSVKKIVINWLINCLIDWMLLQPWLIVIDGLLNQTLIYVHVIPLHQSKEQDIVTKIIANAINHIDPY